MALSGNALSKNVLSAGVSREIITPKVGSYLFGYHDHLVSHSVNDQLTVTALALESGNVKTVLLSATVCLIDTDLADKIRARIGKALGIPAQNIILSATHTHTGPRTDGFSKWGTIDTEYCDNIFIPKCVRAARTAMENRLAAIAGVGTTESMVGINRRQLLPDGCVILGQNPNEVYDSTMTVIAFNGTDKKPLANLVHIGAHCTAAGICGEISRDWAGAMTDRLEAETGAVSMFFNGTAADIAPRIPNGRSSGKSIQYAMELGGLAGIDAVRAYKSIKTFREESVSLASGNIELAFLPPIPQDSIPARIEATKNSTWKGWNFEKYSLEQLNALYKTGDPGPQSLQYTQTIVRIGDTVIIPYPFETCTEIGLRLRSYSQFAHTLLFSCTNGSNSYLPAQSQLCRGGYEVESFRWFRPRQLPDNTDTLLIEQNLKLLEKLRDS
ncbi:MAG: hypothetical protein FWD78_11325 [Treponema sp.]|nr:hypothetical protein [Treponema sp.]